MGPYDPQIATRGGSAAAPARGQPWSIRHADRRTVVLRTDAGSSSRRPPWRSGRPEAARVRWSRWRRDGWRRCPAGAPVLPDRTPAGGWSVAPCRAMGCRRDADLCAWRDRSRPAPARVMTERPAVRVLARGGGGGAWCRWRRRPCLAQRRERGGRADGLAHQLAERALPRAVCGHRWEHVFGRLRSRSDGTRSLRTSERRSPAIPRQHVDFGPRR
jgi:hypothetical protein